MRPPGEYRQALAKSAMALAEAAIQRAALPELTWLDLAHHAQVEAKAARVTVKNMVRDGALVPVGWQRREHANRPMRTFRPAEAGPLLGAEGLELQGVLQGWAR